MTALRGTARRAVRRPGAARIARDQLVHATVGLWRTQVVLVFTFAMPLVWLILIGLLAGNDAVDANGVRVMQFATPTAIAMGTFFATMPPVAISVAEEREHGVLKRLRGTPLPSWAYFLGRIGAAIVFALASLIVTVLLSVALYEVRLQPETLVASAATLVLGVVCFSSVGLAIGALSRTTAMAEAAAIGAAVVLSFISGLFLVGATLPSWLDAIASAFPLKPYARSLQDQFNPFLDGSGWDLGALAIVAAWGAAGALVSMRAFRWEPHLPRRAARARPAIPARPLTGVPALAARGQVGRRPSALRLVVQQSGAAFRTTARRPGDVFFALVMPVALFVLLVAVQPTEQAPGAPPVVVAVAASMITWGAGVTLFMNLPEALARARDARLLKRLRGTPLPLALHLAGRTVAALLLTLVIAAAVLTIGALAFGLRLGSTAVLLGSAVLLLGGLALAACGVLLATLVPTARAVGAVGLVVLFLLAFFSDVFISGGPEWMGAVGSLFPLKHLQNALVAVWAPATASSLWVHLVVLAAWAAGAGALALHRFRWQTSEA